ncbi:MAG: YceD family protein [Steroidobacteraceae bacterium]
MSKPGPDRVDAGRLAAEQARVVRAYPLAQFTRLADAIVNRDGVVRVDARFSEVQRRPAVDLDIEGVLSVRCQRCLGALRVPVESHVGLVFDASPERQDASPGGDYEALPIDPHAVDLAALVEDELLLSVPLVPLHEDCDVAGQASVAVVEAAPDEGTQRPFAGLKDLLKH